jgi:hypothetical protein
MPMVIAKLLKSPSILGQNNRYLQPHLNHIPKIFKYDEGFSVYHQCAPVLY